MVPEVRQVVPSLREIWLSRDVVVRLLCVFSYYPLPLLRILSILGVRPNPREQMDDVSSLEEIDLPEDRTGEGTGKIHEEGRPRRLERQGESRERWGTTRNMLPPWVDSSRGSLWSGGCWEANATTPLVALVSRAVMSSAASASTDLFSGV